MSRRHVQRILLILLLAATVAGCTLPGAALPTPFTFPTPNLTLTAIFAPTETSTPEPPTPEVPPTETATGAVPTLPGGTPGATATSGVYSSRPNGSPITAPFMAAAPTIDGNTSEWTGAAYTADRATYGAANWSGTSDLSATYFLGWDTNHLYLAVRVRDDRFVQAASGRYLYRGDSVEMLLDVNLATDYTSNTLSSDDYQLGLSPGNFASLPTEAYLWYPASSEGARTSVAVRARTTTDGYELEASIPWSVFGVVPSDGSRFGFAFSVSDNDAPGTTTQQSLVSGVSTRRLTNPTTWGTLILD
ncbi:MAG: hypothetical protein A2Y93_17305 [Chloroflexi bacterium RBG_13_68_17]|nr:MAG: hypothetical protein A2Y93_17305 [Chloroflexi bacterium RBG_13_68_17]